MKLHITQYHPSEYQAIVLSPDRAWNECDEYGMTDYVPYSHRKDGMWCLLDDDVVSYWKGETATQQIGNDTKTFGLVKQRENIS